MPVKSFPQGARPGATTAELAQWTAVINKCHELTAVVTDLEDLVAGQGRDLRDEPEIAQMRAKASQALKMASRHLSSAAARKGEVAV